MPKPPSKVQKKPSKNQMKKQVFQQKKQQKQIQKKQFKHGVAKKMRSYQKHFAEFEEQMKPLGLMIRDVDGDGNCLFRSISDFQSGKERDHMKYRRIAVDLMEKKSDFYSLFIEDDMTFQQYLREMGKDGEWGGHLELQALTSALNINFIIHMKGRPAMVLTSMEDGLDRKQSLKSKSTVHLAYHLVDNVAEHYSSIRLINDNTQAAAKEIPLNIFGTAIDSLPDYQQEEQFEEIDAFDESNLIYDEDTETQLQQFQSEGLDDEETLIQQQVAEIWAFEKSSKLLNGTEQKQKQSTETQVLSQDDTQKSNVTFQDQVQGPSKNKKCPCGSKLRYKNCCQSKDIVGQINKSNPVGKEEEQKPINNIQSIQSSILFI